MNVHGAHGLVLVPLRMGIWRYYSGLERMDVHGTIALVPWPLGMGIWRCRNGQERMDAQFMEKTKILRRTKKFGSGGGEWMPGMKAANGYKNLTATFWFPLKSAMMA